MCRQLKGSQWDEGQCVTCLPPLIEENIDAAQIYLVVRNQLIFGPRGPVDVNQLAIHEAMKLFRIQNKRECFEKVIMLASHFLEKMRMEAEGQ